MSVNNLCTWSKTDDDTFSVDMYGVKYFWHIIFLFLIHIIHLECLIEGYTLSAFIWITSALEIQLISIIYYIVLHQPRNRQLQIRQK
jgi:hypothetical protein